MPDGFLKTLPVGRARELRFHGIENLRIGRNLRGYLFGPQQFRLESIVQVRRVVGDFVRQIDDLSFQHRAQTGQILIEKRRFAGLEIPRVFHDAFAHFKGQIQPGESGIAVFD